MKVRENKQICVPNGQCVGRNINPYILPHMPLRGMYLKEKEKRIFKE
jgi:hypothetical protein